MERRLRIGVAGLGRAFALMLPTLRSDFRIQLTAAADPRIEARSRFASEFGAKTYASVATMAEDPDIDAIYVATPHHLHADHVVQAAQGGKHILVEKPLAITLAECERMVAAAHTAGVYLIVGHSHSFDAPYLRARDVIESGLFGKLRMLTAINFTDFMYRPRRQEELVTRLGGGVVFSQGAHQVDVARLLGGGRVRSVRAATSMLDLARQAEGAYSVQLMFENGTIATLIYSGYGHFDSDELCGWIGELGVRKNSESYGEARKNLQRLNRIDEGALKAERAYGGAAYAESSTVVEGAHHHFGFVIASCEKADLRPVPQGIMVYADFEKRFETVPTRSAPRAEVVDELYDACVHGRKPLHSGEWGTATLEVCLAILQSSEERREIKLLHQVSTDG